MLLGESDEERRKLKMKMKKMKKGLKRVLLVLPLTDKIISSSSAAKCLTPDRLTRGEREERKRRIPRNDYTHRVKRK